METALAGRLLATAAGFQPSCVLAAGAELDVFGLLGRGRLAARELARRARSDPRAMTVLLDALAALGWLRKSGGRYANIPGAERLLAGNSPRSVLPTLRHQANCLRRWAHLAAVVRSGRPARTGPSVLGRSGDRASFIGAMDAINRSAADLVVADLKLKPFRRLLDVGGASGTWTRAFLRRFPEASAVLFDLPPVLPMARERLRRAGLLGRVRLAGGNFLRDALPKGCDAAWVSAIAHQNSRGQNRRLFRNVFAALDAGGFLLVRDVVMSDDRVRPTFGALFAVNMLVATPGGGTYTFAEYREDLRRAGFSRVRRARRDDGMHGVIRAIKSP